MQSRLRFPPVSHLLFIAVRPADPRPLADCVPSPQIRAAKIALLFTCFGVIHVVTAVITAEKDKDMTTSIQETENATAQAVAEQPKTTKKARSGARVAPVAAKKGKPGKKATTAKRAPKSAKKAAGARDGSKAAKILDLLKRLMAPRPKN
jgi:hypothetical protein